MNKDFLLSDSKTFCMMPWIHLHTVPTGIAAPCCISKACITPGGVGNSNTSRLMDLVNSPKMNQLRLDMLSENKNSECDSCYAHDNLGIESFRKSSIRDYGHFIDRALANTNFTTGELTEFQMLYFDIRFNNICNFKCRTCAQEYSSQWEQENLRNEVPYAKPFTKNTNKEFLNDVIEQIPYMECAYFAGGEPLITEEHYVLLEEMIKQNRTDIVLKYNTNISNLIFKNKDLLGLWKHFTNPIDLSASIDHIKERAEYIRHGTNWGTIEENFKLLIALPNVTLSVNSVLSVFNFTTLDVLYNYLIDNGMYDKTKPVYSLYPMSTPHYLSTHILPDNLKQLGAESARRAINKMTENEFTSAHIEQIETAINWAYSASTWEEQKETFKAEINRIDRIRGEDFRKTFPELALLMDMQ